MARRYVCTTTIAAFIIARHCGKRNKRAVFYFVVQLLLDHVSLWISYTPRKLPNLVFLTLLGKITLLCRPVGAFNHPDFMWGRDAGALLYRDIVRLLTKHSRNWKMKKWESEPALPGDTSGREPGLKGTRQSGITTVQVKPLVRDHQCHRRLALLLNNTI